MRSYHDDNRQPIGDDDRMGLLLLGVAAVMASGFGLLYSLGAFDAAL